MSQTAARKRAKDDDPFVTREHDARDAWRPHAGDKAEPKEAKRPAAEPKEAKRPPAEPKAAKAGPAAARQAAGQGRPPRKGHGPDPEARQQVGLRHARHGRARGLP